MLGLTRTTETYIKLSTTRRGGTPDQVCTICCFISFFFKNTKQKNVSYLYFLLKSRILFGEKTLKKNK